MKLIVAVLLNVDPVNPTADESVVQITDPALLALHVKGNPVMELPATQVPPLASIVMVTCLPIFVYLAALKVGATAHVAAPGVQVPSS
jgi:hypothetical protein